MAAEAVDCTNAGVSCMKIDLAVLGVIYAIANIERRLATPPTMPASKSSVPVIVATTDPPRPLAGKS